MNNFKMGIEQKYTNQPKAGLIGQYNHEMFDEAISGLLAGLERHSGKINDVTEIDILSSCAINPDAFRFYYRTPDGILKDIYKEIGDIVAKEEESIVPGDTHNSLRNLYARLSGQPVMIRIIFLIDDTSVWSRSLKRIIKTVAVGWPDEKDAWDYLYQQFVFQFHSILKKWMEANFAKEHLEDCAQLAELWLTADKLIGQSAGKLLAAWK